MKYERSIFINRPVAEVFDFCSSRRGFLEHFPYKTNWIDGPDHWEAPGTALTFTFYMFKLIPIHYKAELTAFEKNRFFRDEMRQGPYKSFVHTHSFEEVEGGTLYRDTLEFTMGMGAMIDKYIALPMTSSTFEKRHQLMEKALVGDNLSKSERDKKELIELRKSAQPTKLYEVNSNNKKAS